MLAAWRTRRPITDRPLCRAVAVWARLTARRQWSSPRRRAQSARAWPARAAPEAEVKRDIRVTATTTRWAWSPSTRSFKVIGRTLTGCEKSWRDWRFVAYYIYYCCLSIEGVNAPVVYYVAELICFSNCCYCIHRQFHSFEKCDSRSKLQWVMCESKIIFFAAAEKWYDINNTRFSCSCWYTADPLKNWFRKITLMLSAKLFFHNFFFFLLIITFVFFRLSSEKWRICLTHCKRNASDASAWRSR